MIVLYIDKMILELVEQLMRNTKLSGLRELLFNIAQVFV